MIVYQFEHDENCELHLRYQSQEVRGYWCSTHLKWMYERPVKIIAIFADGQELIVT